jgi:hypothetical protein
VLCNPINKTEILTEIAATYGFPGLFCVLALDEPPELVRGYEITDLHRNE